MENVTILKRVYFAYLGYVYWFARETTRRKILGIRPRTLIRLLTFILPIWAWLGEWGQAALIGTIILFLWVQLTYWHTRRAGYFRFVADPKNELPQDDLTPLPPNKHVQLFATGEFSLKDRENVVLFHKAEYWQMPLGDHGLMVEEYPGSFLYQFFNATSLQMVQHGVVLYGSQPRPALSITFLSTWGPEFGDDITKNSEKAAKKQRTIYLSFENPIDERLVWHNIIEDARRVRSD